MLLDELDAARAYGLSPNTYLDLPRSERALMTAQHRLNMVMAAIKDFDAWERAQRK